MENHSRSLDTVFQALADPTRRAVIQRLTAGSASVKELAEPFAIGLPAFMKHIRVLEDGGLITSTKVGRVRTCFLKPERLAVTEHWLNAQRRLWEGRADRLAALVENTLNEDAP